MFAAVTVAAVMFADCVAVWAATAAAAVFADMLILSVVAAAVAVLAAVTVWNAVVELLAAAALPASVAVAAYFAVECVCGSAAERCMRLSECLLIVLLCML